MVCLDKEEALKQIHFRKEVFEKALDSAYIKNNLIAKVVFVMDISGSMTPLYNSGVMQELTEKIFPVALKLDDDGELEMFIFDNYVKELEPLNKENFFGYVNDKIRHRVGGGTEYAPVIKKIIKKYTKHGLFKRKSADIPTFVIFQTDGDNSDPSETSKALKEAAKYNIFFKFIGTGRERFTYLRDLEYLGDDVRKNTHFIKIPAIHDISDEQLYNDLLVGFKDFLDTFKG